MTIKNLHFNILIGLNSFIIFFLLFENSIQVPAYLQVVGRMHPLLLHFPIVLLVICWILYLFRSRLEKEVPALQSILHSLLFISSLLTAITVIMGLLLSKEGGFEGTTYEIHKYTGVGLSLLTLALLAFIRFNPSGRYQKVFAVGMNVSIVLLLMVGHFGASLTHGEDFIMSPIMEKKSKELDAETAIVFEDAVMPILQAKCVGCHNSSKPKGGLVLSDSSSILKGGENGKVFIAGNALTSLMIERILLDIEHEHKMPPKGKPQLSIDEVSLLRAWIQSGGKFDVPLSAFAVQDTLFQAVKSVYGFAGAETYEFAAADEAEVKKLNTPYRIINPLDAGSPALDVNFYGKDFFTDKSLSELSPIADQVVSVNLSSMPIKKADIQTLNKFKNLRTLNLNNSKITNEDLALLKDHENLKSVSLIGTGVSINGIKSLVKLPNMRKIFVWNTALKPAELEAIRKDFPTIKIDAGFKTDDSQKLALTPPRINPNRSFFQKEISLSLSHPIVGVQLRYTLDGTNPDSSTAKIYKEPILLKKDAMLRVKAVKDGWLPSNEINQSFYATSFSPNTIVLETKPNQQYKARKEQSFFDLESGGNNNADGKWLGFQGNDLSTTMSFDQAIALDTLALSIKQSYNEHIYPPEYIEIWGGTDSLNLKLLNKVKLDLDKVDKMRYKRMIACAIPNQKISFIRLKTKHYPKIPQGFPGDGNPPWLFVDEIILK